MMKNKLKKLFDELDVYCDFGREGLLINALCKKLPAHLAKELLWLVGKHLNWSDDFDYGEEGKPSDALKSEVRLLKCKAESLLGKRRSVMPSDVDAFWFYSKFKNDPHYSQLARYEFLVALDYEHPGAMLENAKLQEDQKLKELWLMKSVDAGCSEAAFQLAILHYNAGSIEKYQKWLQRAWHMGHVEARFKYICDFMEHTEYKDPLFATMLRDMEDLAIEYRHVGAMTKIAFYFGDSTRPFYDLDKALFYWKRSANPDNPESCYYLSLYYRKLGEEKENSDSKSEADECYQLAIKYAKYGFQGMNPWCGRQLGFVLMNQERYDESYEVFERLSDNGDGCSTRILGLFYSKGLGRDVSWERALPFFQKAVDQGYTCAEDDIGLSLEHLGKPEESLEHYVRALEAGYTFTAKRLSILLEEGTVFEKDEKLAGQLRDYYDQIEGGPKPFWGR